MTVILDDSERGLDKVLLGLRTKNRVHPVTQVISVVLWVQLAQLKLIFLVSEPSFRSLKYLKGRPTLLVAGSDRTLEASLLTPPEVVALPSYVSSHRHQDYLIRLAHLLVPREDGSRTRVASFLESDVEEPLPQVVRHLFPLIGWLE